MEKPVSLLPNLSNRRMVIVLEHIANPMYLEYLWAIVLNASKQGTKTTIFDCDWDKFEYSNESHDRMREKNISRMRDQFLKTLSDVAKNSIEIVGINANEVQVDKKEIMKVSNFSQADEIHFQFGNSLRSVFARNYLSTSNLSLKGSRMRKQFRIYVQSFLTMRSLCQKLFSSSDFDLILIANGRFPSETAIRVAAEDSSIEFYFYEHGMPKGESFHFAPFQTQEFLKIQRFIQNQIENESEIEQNDLLAFSNKWLYNQATNLNQNPYLNQDTGIMELKKRIGDKRLAVIFNSSIDEKFSNMGVNLNGWESQKQATSAIAGTLVKQGFYVVVRIHPNTANKSWWDLINLVHHLRDNAIDYILPWNGPSSYTLLEECDLVLTWGSTICMESVARGIPTVVFGRTMYDEIAGVTIVNPCILRTIDFNNIEHPDPLKGKVAIYYNKHWGYKLDDYCSRDDLALINIIVDNKQTTPNPLDFVPSLAKSVQLKMAELFILLRRIRKGRYASPNDYRRLVEIFLSGKVADSAANFSLSFGLKIRALTRDGEVSI